DAVYGSPLLQALVGLKATDVGSRVPGKDTAHLALGAQRIKELKAAIPEGGPREAAIRAILYVHRPDGVFDERGFNLMRRLREEAGGGMTLGEFKRLVREQVFMLLVDERRPVEAIPAMLAKEPALAAHMRAMFRRLIETVGLRSDEARSRLAELEHLIAESADPKDSPERQHFAKLRPLPIHSGRTSKHGGTAG